MMNALIILVVHASALCLLAWWYARSYRRAARRSRRELERRLSDHTTESLRREVEFLQERNEILLRGLFPRGDVFPGNFVEQDPELRALCELLELFRGQPLPVSFRPAS